MRAIRKGLMFLALLGFASGVGRMAGSFWAGQAGNGAASSTPLNESLVAGVTALASAAELDQEEAESPAQQAGAVDEASAQCLECHGPFEELKAKPGNFVITDWRGESKINPHLYVPHDSKEIPACINCHVVHSVPPESTPEKPKYIKWCYDVCHHQQDFTVCSSCHEGR